jgi:hypothetical protein
MTRPTRLAGWGTDADGSIVTWTVADGRKGRRWREVVSTDGVVVHALLLETDADRRFRHLELARADGLWTFHPEPDGTLHGNHVGRGVPGVRHVVGWAFAPGDALLVEGSPLGLAAVALASGATLEAGRPAAIAGVVVRADGDLVQVPDIRLERLSATRWRVGEWSPIEVDELGIPVLDGGETQPLELG